MQHGHQVPEGLPEPGDGLRSQRDLGHEHDGTPAPRQGPPDQLDVDQGLPRTGHPVQKEGPAPVAQRGLETGQNLALAQRGSVRGFRTPRLAPKRIPHDDFFHHPHEPLLLQAPDHAAAETAFQHRGQRLAPPRAHQLFVRLALPPRPAEDPVQVREGTDRLDHAHHRSPRGRRLLPGRLRHAGGQHGAQHDPRRRHVVLGDPFGELHQLGPDGGFLVEHRGDIPHPPHLRPPTQHPPHQRAVPERHQHPRSRRGRSPCDPVRERTPHRNRKRHLHERTRPRGHHRVPRSLKNLPGEGRRPAAAPPP